MSRIEELIKEKCPNGVVYKTLGELGEFMGGLTGKSKDDFSDGNAVFITYKNVYSNLALDIEPLDRVKIAEGENQRTLEYGDVIFTGSSETPDECGISSVVTRHPSKALYLNSFCFVFRFNDLSIIEPDFAKHLFRSHNLRYQIRKTAAGVTRFNVSKDKMKKIMIPLPPIEVQQELARILDKFAELEEGLQSELEARKKQYKYFLDDLLRFDDNVPVVRLDEISEIYDSLHATPAYVDAGYSMIRVADVKSGYVDTSVALKVDEETYRHYIKKYKPQFNDIIISRVGSFGNTCLIGTEEVCLGQNIALIHSKICAKYLYYYLNTAKIRAYFDGSSNGAAYKNLSLARIKETPIAVPDIKTQEQIVDILEKLDTISGDTKNGLSAEITARHKQYEYYRDKLFSFKRVGDVE